MEMPFLGRGLKNTNLTSLIKTVQGEEKEGSTVQLFRRVITTDGTETLGKW
jgi:hypothetical protein